VQTELPWQQNNDAWYAWRGEEKRGEMREGQKGKQVD
jgi:hypothetical protein